MLAENLNNIVTTLVPVLKQFCKGECTIAVGGSHAQQQADSFSDINIYIFTDEVIKNDARSELLSGQIDGVETVISWGDESELSQAGTDFIYNGTQIECWIRSTKCIEDSIKACCEGKVDKDVISWSTKGYYSYGILSDLPMLIPVYDPQNILAHWKADTRNYPDALRENITTQYLSLAESCADNSQYIAAIERSDVMYAIGVVNQAVHSLIQVIFAKNRCYFPGDKRILSNLNRLSCKPEAFEDRVRSLIWPNVDLSQNALEQQRKELLRLVKETKALS